MTKWDQGLELAHLMHSILAYSGLSFGPCVRSERNLGHTADDSVKKDAFLE